MASLNIFSSSIAVGKSTSSLPSPSLFPSNHKPRAARYTPYSASKTSLRLANGHHRGNSELRWKPSSTSPTATVVALVNPQSLKVMISGAPASGKGTQCELIKEKYGLVHISAGDLLREEIAAGTENGRQAKEFMEKGMLVPNEIVVTMVKERLLQPDAEKHGWLLDGYPRSLSQAMALENLSIQPDIFIVLDVSDEILVERVVGRRLDPVTGRIYHLKYSPPENEEVAARLTQRFDDTEEKVKLRLQTHYQNVESVLSIYEAVTFKVNGNAPKEDVFAQIDKALSSVIDKATEIDSSTAAGMAQ
ncbi:adenylate kinase, chloroplastic-like isoform X2 [Typha latifolia]|uniref:adenylate kinase, chloroplastic-like isoform X2 n=1 Tax=Typha latifolia TaxID=4733 RepID=UPI003C3039CC